MRRHQSGSVLARWFNERVGTTKGRIRRIMLTAMAKKLVVALWKHLTDGVIPQGVALKA